MSSDLKFKLALTVLLASLFSLMVKNLVGKETLRLDVIPHVVAVNPYKAQTFRVRFWIEPSDDNREYSYLATCGGEQKLSIRKVEYASYTVFEDLYVLNDCVFQVCLSRVGYRTPVCVKKEVLTGG